MLRNAQQSRTARIRSTATAPLRRPGGEAVRDSGFNRVHAQIGHPLSRVDENARLLAYEDDIKQAFDNIVPALKRISAIQHEPDFEIHAQAIARSDLGFELPADILADAWVEQLDMRRLHAWCVFQTYRHFCDEFFKANPLADDGTQDFEAFLQDCGFHTLDISPCADGRLAHLVRYILRLPPRAVRRKSYAGAMFDIDDSIQKWIEIELMRHREGKPNTSDAPTRYLKMAAYHFSSINPRHEGCAAHGSDMHKAAAAALDRLTAFRTAIENGFCCGASIDLLLIGIDTDSDAIRVHIPDSLGGMALDRYVDTQTVYANTTRLRAPDALRAIVASIQECCGDVAPGMAKLIAYLIENNMSQIDYVMNKHGDNYPDIGHAERFIGAGVGFEDIQLRNLMYFAYLDTVEEGAADMDVGIKIFKGLNVSHGLPVPIVVRFDYHGQVPGSRERAQQRCARVAKAIADRYPDLFRENLLHVMQAARDCDGNDPIEIFACTVNPGKAGDH